MIEGIMALLERGTAQVIDRSFPHLRLVPPLAETPKVITEVSPDRGKLFGELGSLSSGAQEVLVPMVAQLVALSLNVKGFALVHTPGRPTEVNVYLEGDQREHVIGGRLTVNERGQKETLVNTCY
jgi:hypothetical protein